MLPIGCDIYGSVLGESQGVLLLDTILLSPGTQSEHNKGDSVRCQGKVELENVLTRLNSHRNLSHLLNLGD